MGYRSLVGIAFRRDSKDAPSIPTVLALAKTKGILSGDEIGEHWKADEDYGWDDDKFLFYVENVKWYDGYPDVMLMEKLFEFVESLNEMTEDNAALTYSYSGIFCRVGEEDSDNETRSFGDDPWSLMWLNRSIGFEHSDLLGNQAKPEEQPAANLETQP